jgi:peptide/nickel transport system substrate-binding protein
MIQRFFRRQWRLIGASLMLVSLIGVFTVLTINSNPVTPQSNSRIIDSVRADPQTFNVATDMSFTDMFSFLYEGLVKENGLTGALEPALAESWQISEEGRRIVFALRPQLRWSDGQPLTADDVVFSYNQVYSNEALPIPARDNFRLGNQNALPTVNKLDRFHVEFMLPEPFAPFLRATQAAILPRHALSSAVSQTKPDGTPALLTTWGTDTDPSQIICNGPYQLEDYQPGERITFQRNPYYWRKDAQQRSQPYIDQVVWYITESFDTSFMQFRSGDLDSYSLAPQYFPLLKREESRGNFTIYNGGPSLGLTFLAFNLNQGQRNGKPLVDPIKSRWFNKVEFRQAVAHAIDRQTMLVNTFLGLGEIITSSIPNQSPYYAPPQDGIPSYDYNPEKARNLLLSAGFKYNDIGVLLDDQGNRVRFTLITDSGHKLREAMGAQIQRDLGQIGIQVDFQPLAFNALTNKLFNSLDWECHLIGLFAGIEPHDNANIWLADGKSHLFNLTPQSNQEPIYGRRIAEWEMKISQLYIQGAKTLDESQRKAIYHETQRLIAEYAPVIYLVKTFSLTAVRNRVGGIKHSALSKGNTFWNINELTLVN